MSTRRIALAFDAVLGPRVRAYSGETLYRARLIAVTSLALALSAAVMLALIGLLGWGALFVPTTVVSTLILLGNLWLLRRTGRLDVAAITLCVTVVVALFALTWSAGGLDHPALDWTLPIAICAPIILRRSLAIACVAAIVGGILFEYVADLAGHQFPALDAHVRESMDFSSHLLLTLIVAALAWSYDRARRDALTERDDVLAKLEETREARLALVENVQAVVYSIDRELRLIAGNSLFDRLSHASGQPPIAPGQYILDGLAEAQHADMKALYARAFAGEHFTVERTLALRSHTFDCEILFNPIRRASGEVRAITVLGRDISERKRAATQLQRLNRDLAEVAHLAGKAEVATDVLHNVGNVLTALNSSADLVLEQLQASKIPFVAKTVALLPSEHPELVQFITLDPRGTQIRPYLAMLATELEHERSEMIAAVDSLHEQLDHVKSVIARQQASARTDHLVETVSVAEVIESALELHAVGLAGVSVATELASLPPLLLERHKLVEILTNLLINSLQALEASADKRIVIRAALAGGTLRIDVVDTGIGIAAEHRDRLFSYGFTTKPEGHGFGLAGSLLAARSMGGTVRCHSDGPGTGATFMIELPVRTAATSHPQEYAA